MWKKFQQVTNIQFFNKHTCYSSDWKASLVLSSNYFFKNKSMICLLSEVLKLNFICEHKWELKLLTIPLGYPQSSGMCISHAICDLCMMFPKDLLFFCMSLREDHWNLRWKRFLHFWDRSLRADCELVLQWDVFPLLVICLHGVGSYILTWGDCSHPPDLHRSALRSSAQFPVNNALVMWKFLTDAEKYLPNFTHPS